MADHPRSRGVYSRQYNAARMETGSSPLARGLRCRLQHLSILRRIIPARAGFTCKCTRKPRMSKDHPRSRGVYVRVVLARSPAVGSSPLARGLQVDGGGDNDVEGIIPARAGFTRFPPGNSNRTRGSSPLARGLRILFDASKHLIRIIPARAGFTLWTSSSKFAATDHPRSRGVYPGSAFAVSDTAGSSPLARGLPLRDVVGETLTRIIPARAGFTRELEGFEALNGDHPRSRGVYG